jgi:hypothetical protein
MKSLFVVAAILTAVLAGDAAAQTAPTPNTPAISTTDKKAVSKACSEQADAKGLHGKQRKKFRSECRKNGAKS